MLIDIEDDEEIKHTHTHTHTHAVILELWVNGCFHLGEQKQSKLG